MSVGKRKIELNALLEVTQAINANIPEDHLYKVLYFICISSLKLTEVALYVNEEEQLLEKFAHSFSFTKKELALFKEHEFDLKRIENSFDEIEHVIRVSHKNKLLAFLVIGKSDQEDQKEKISFIQTLLNIVMVAIENKRLARKELEQGKIKREVEIARDVQSMLIPRNLPNDKYFQIAATYLPHQSVGGDYYDVIRIGEKDLIICMADVSGKGVPAAMIMSNFQASLRTIARMTHEVDVIIKDLNDHLNQNAASDHFITCFLAYYNGRTRTLEYVNAGHNPPYLNVANNLKELTEGCFMLGAFPTIPKINKGKVYVPNKSQLFLYTDGITETANDSGEEFGEKRLEEFLLNNDEIGLQLKQANLIVELDDFKETQNYRDDLTMLSVNFL